MTAEMTAEILSVDAGPPAERRLIVIDPGVEDAGLLRAGIAPGVETVALAGPGLTGLAATLAGRGPVAELHVLAHGAPGSIRLGGQPVTASDLQASSAALAGLVAALAPGARIVLYGCETGRGAEGRAFTAALSQVTGARVASAKAPVGARARGGSWQIAWPDGTLAPLAIRPDARAAWPGLLVDVEFTREPLESNPTNNENDLTFFIDFSFPLAVSSVNNDDFVLNLPSGIVNVPGFNVTPRASGVSAERSAFQLEIDPFVGLPSNFVGEIGIDLASDADFFVVGNDITPEPAFVVVDETYTLDLEPPRVILVERIGPEIIDGSVAPQVLVGFNESIASLDNFAFFTFFEAGGLARIDGNTRVISRPSSSQAIVELDLTGLAPTATGTVSLGIDSIEGSADFTDIAGNSGVTTLPTGANFETFQLDQIAPTISDPAMQVDLTSAAIGTTVFIDLPINDTGAGIDPASLGDITVFADNITAEMPVAALVYDPSQSSIDLPFASLGTLTLAFNVVNPSAAENGFVELTIDGFADLAGNTETQFVGNIFVDFEPQAPFIESITRQTPTAEDATGDSFTWRIDFSEPVQQSDGMDLQPELFELAEGPGTGFDISVTNVGGLDEVYDITVSDIDPTDDVGFDFYNGPLALGFATDALAIEGSASPNLLLDLDLGVTPTIYRIAGAYETFFVGNAPAGATFTPDPADVPVTSDTTIDYFVTFGSTVTNVSLDDFVPVFPGGTATLTSVTEFSDPQPDDTGQLFAIRANVDGEGPFSVAFAPGSDIFPAPASVSTTPTNVDTVRPEVVSILRAPSQPEFFNGAPVEFVVTFSEPVLDFNGMAIDEGVFEILLDDGGPFGQTLIFPDEVSLIQTGPTDYLVSVGGSFSEGSEAIADAEGLLSVAVVPTEGGALFEDAAGNVGREPVSGAVESVTLDNTAPTLTLVNISDPTITDADFGSQITVDYTINEPATFSAGFGVDFNTPEISTIFGLAAVEFPTPTQLTLTFDIMQPSANVNTFTDLSVFGVEDRAGNLGGLRTANAFDVNVTGAAGPLLVTDILSDVADGLAGIGETVTLTLVLDEAITAANFDNGEGGGVQVTFDDGRQVLFDTVSAPGRLSGSFTVAAGDEATALTATAVTLVGGAGFSSDLGAPFDFQGFAPEAELGVQPALEIDGIRPVVEEVVRDDAAMILGGGVTSVPFVVTFTEAIDAASVTPDDFVPLVDGETTGAQVSVAIVPGSNDQSVLVTFTDTVPGDGLFLDDYEGAFALGFGTIFEDLAGNTNAIDEGGQPLVNGQQQSYTIDNGAPPLNSVTVTPMLITQADVGGTFEARFVFGETLAADLLSQPGFGFAITGGNPEVLANLAIAFDGPETLVLTADIVAPSAPVSVADLDIELTGVADVIGNTRDVTVADAFDVVVIPGGVQIASIVADPTDAGLGQGDSVDIALTVENPSAPGRDIVFAPGTGELVLLLSNGATVVFDTAQSGPSPLELTATYTVGAGDGESADLTVVSAALVDGARFEAENGVEFAFSSTLPAGQNLADTSDVVVDLTAPMLVAGLESDTGVPDDNITNVAGPVIGGTVDEAVTLSVAVDGSPEIADQPVGPGAWSLDLASFLVFLDPGPNDIAVTATDAVGNTATETFTVVRDTANPSLSVVLQSDTGLPSDGVTNDDAPLIGGEVGEASTLTISLGGDGEVADTVIADGIAVPAGAWSFDLGSVGATLEEGENLITVVATDVAGNATSRNLRPTLDTVAPTIDSLLVQGGPAFEDVTTIGFRIVFSEEVLGFGAADLTLVEGLDVAFGTGQDGAPNAFEISVFGDGFVPYDGPVTPALAPATDVTDAAGNLITDFTPATLAPASLNTLAPVYLGSTRAVPAGETTDADTITFRLRFSEAVTGLDAADIAVTTTPEPGFPGIAPSDLAVSVLADPVAPPPGEFTALVQLTGPGIAEFNGTVSVDLLATNDAVDGLGQTTELDPARVNQAFILDNVLPPGASGDAFAVAEDGTLVGLNILGNDAADDATIVSVDTSLTTGTVVFDPAGQTVDYTASGFDALPAGATANDTFTYAISNVRGTSTATVSITVTGVNDAPVAADDAATTGEDSAVTIPVLANDTDADTPAEALSIAMVEMPDNGGTVSIDGQSLEFDPMGAFDDLRTGETRLTSFAYMVADGLGGMDVGLVQVTVTGVNDAPVAVDDRATTFAETSVEILPLSNDTDPDALPGELTIAAIGVPDNGGTAELDGATVTFDPNGEFAALAAGATAESRFPVNVVDGEGATSVSEIVVTVTGVNNGPVAADDAATTDEDTPVAIAPLANDTDIDGSPAGLSVASLSQPDNGGSVSLANGIVTFQPGDAFDDLAAGESRETRSGYTVTDGQGGTDTGEIVVTVTGVNDAPVAADDAAMASESGSVQISPLLNDTDIDTPAAALTASLLGQPDNGGAASLANGVVTFAADGDFEDLALGETRLTRVAYGVSDGEGGTDTGEIVVTVTGENDAPVAVDDLAGTDEATGLALFPLLNDTDVDAAPGELAILSFTQPTAGGSVVRAGNGLFFDPAGAFDGLAPGESGSAVFSYSVVDGEGATDTAEITVTVSGVNDAPVAADDVATTDEDTSVSVPVLANDNDAEGNDGLTIVGVSVPDAGGTATIQGGAILFNPVGDFEDLSDGEARVSGFTYTLRDADGAEAIARAEVTVEGVNDLPVPGPDTATLAEGARIAVPVLANDSDAEDPRALLSIASVGPVEGGGTATLEGREIRYDTAGAFESLGVDETATVSVPFVVADTDGGTAPGLLTITVTGENDAPEPADDGFMISEDAAATLDVFFNDTDPDGDPLVLASVGGPEGGAATRADGDLAVFDPNGAFDRLAPGETAESRFIYTVADPSGAEGAAFVTVTIEGVNDAPVAEDDVSVAASEGTSLVPVLGNDSDVDGPASGLRVTAVGPVTGGGTASASGTGVTYDPGTAFLGLNGTAVVSFAYTVADAFGATDTATVTLTIDGENAPPVALDDTAETTPATPVSVDVLVNDSDAEGPVNLIEIVETRGAGAFSIDGESVEFDPTGAFDDLLGNQVAVAEADYRIADADGTTAVATVTVTIAGENRAPVATDDTATTGEDAALTVQVLDNDSDAEDPTAALALASVGTATGGGTATAVGRAIEFDPTGAFDTLNVGQTATVEVPYTVADTAGATDTGTLTVTITGVNDAPVAAADTGATDPDTAITLDVLANDTDVDDAAAGFTLVSVGIPNAGGSATLVDGQIAFDPGTAFLDLGAGETRQTSFSYVMADPGGLESAAEVVVTVTGGAPVNRPPVAGDDTASTLQGVPVVVDVLATDIDPDPGDTLSVVSIDEVRRDGVPTALAVTLVEGGIRVAAGAAFVALAAGQTSVVEVDHTIADALGATDQATAAVTVIGVNDVPVAVDDTGEVAAGATVQVDVLANDSDPDAGDEISLASIEGVRRDGTPAELDVEIVGGEIQLAATEAFAALGSGQTATVEVDYAITDSLGAAATATAVITVRGGNQPPNAVADAGATTAGVPVAIDVLANDTDADSDPNGFEILSVGTPDAGGTATLVNGEVLFNPAGAFADLGIGESRQTVFTYLLADGDGATDTATVTVTVTGAAGGENLPPIALDDSGTLAAGEALTLPVTLNDLDPEGGEISLLGIEGVRRDGEVADLAVAPVGDGIRLSAGTAFRSLGEGATSVVAVDYTIADPEGLTAPGLARFTVVGVNDAPVARDDTGNAVAGLAAPLYAVLANDSDVDMGDVLTLAAVTGQRVNGLAIDVGAEIDGAALSFDATAPAFADLAPGETATLEIDYAVSDLAGAPDTATLTVTVEGGPDEGQNLAPIVEDDAGTTTAGTPLVIDVLASDIDPEGAPLTLASIDAVRRDGVPSEVAVTIVADGLRLAAGNAFVALAAGETSTVEADHTVTDPEGAAATATARFTVEGVNDAPIARDDEAAAEEGATLTVDVLANDRDPDDGDTLSLATVGEIRFAGQPVQVPATATEDGIEIATAGLPDVTVGETAVLEIDYTIADAAGATDGATLFVTLTGGSEGPIAGDDSLFIERSVGEGTIPLFENDTGGAGGAVTLFDFETGPITLLTFDEAGTVIAEEALPLALVDIAIGPDGVASYRLLAGYPLLATRQAGVQTVTYTVRNEAGETATAEAFFSVDGPGFDQDFLNEGTTIGGRDGNDGGDFIGSPDGIDDSVQGGRGDDLMGGGPGNDTLAGGAGDDQIFGEDGDDVLSGDEGDDTLAGGAGDDEISGGTGNDNVSGGAGDDEISGGTGNDNVSGGAGNDEISGGTGNDTLSGGSQNDTITGGDGDDEISGGDGDDLLEGGPGDDTIDGGADDDAIRGGEGDDSLAGEAGDDLIEGQEGDDTLQGGDGNDTLVGGPGSDSLDGGGGNDDISGGDGNDTLDGGAGNDTIIGEGGNDKLDGGGGDDLLIGDDGNDVLEGGDGNDTIVGEGGNDGLIGGAGDDVLISGPGIDGLIGGNGADRFVFAPGDGSGNQIADFAPEEDTLVLDGFAGLTAQGVIDGLTLGARGLVFSAEGTEVSLDGLVDPSLIPLSAIEIL